METRINSNGSKWAGQAPDTIEQLLDVLNNYALDRRFEEGGNFIMDREPGVRFWGNFLKLSHVFSIDTDEPQTIERLTKAIRENQKRPDYLAQPDPAERRARKRADEQRKLRASQAKREADARRVLGGSA